MMAAGMHPDPAVAGRSGPIGIPTDALRTGAAPEPAQVQAVLDPALAAAVRGLAARHDIDVSTVLLAAWLVLLRRLSGQPALSLLQATAGRPARVLHFEPADGLTVAACLRRVHEQVQVPAADGEDGATATDSAWQVTFTDAPGDAPLPAAELALQAAPDAVAGRGAGADATIHVRLAYDAGLFQAATAERHLACWQTLLRAMCDADDQDILRLPLLDVEQRRQAVERW